MAPWWDFEKALALAARPSTSITGAGQDLGRCTLEASKIVAETERRVIEAAKDDWVQLLEIQGLLVDVAHEGGERLWPDETEGATSGPAPDPWLDRRISLGMEVVADLLNAGRLVPGFLGATFQPWSGTTESWIKRIDSEWRAFGSNLNLNDVCWFDLVDARS